LTFNAEAIFFSDYSLTDYELGIAKNLTTNQNDNRLDVFQQISDNNKIIIEPGLPTSAESQIRISMIIFEPNRRRQTYSKQQLHSDEFPYFGVGINQILIQAHDTHIAPAICFESLQTTHAENAFKLGANVYLASVAKSAKGFEKAVDYYPRLSKQYATPVLMSNCVGSCDNLITVGKSSVWTNEGTLVGQLDEKNEGILIFDTETNEIIKKNPINV
jgi:predicted amidohydrolase